MSQIVKTPKILPCQRCGANAQVIDWEFRNLWRVMCDANHTDTKECGSQHRAICRWNNRQKKRDEIVDMLRSAESHFDSEIDRVLE